MQSRKTRPQNNVPPPQWKVEAWPGLPITERAQEIVTLLREHQVVLVAGETGSGKTTQLPKLCLQAGLHTHGRIVCTQPRRVAALSISRRVAEEMEVTWGREVGCKIRFTDQTDRSTVIKFATDGMLLAELRQDPHLLQYGCIILDEAHERSLNIDFLLGHLRRLRSIRPELRIVVTSATIDTEKFSEAFDGAPVVEVSGKLYPVEVRYQPVETFFPPGEESNYVEALARAAEQLILETQGGDLLAFLPTERDIREAMDLLKGREIGDCEVWPLFGRLSSGEQQQVFHPGRRRRLILATNIAETSLTLPRIRYVIDSGLARISRYQSRSRTRRLPIEAISRSSARQRSGRCGRVGPGVCLRLYSEEDHDARPLYTPPEIRRANLAEVILRMKALDLGEIESFPFVDPPPQSAVTAGYNLLQELSALDQNRTLTGLGRQLAAMPVDPTLGRMLLQAHKEGVLAEVSVIATALSIQDPRERPADHRAEADAAHRTFQHPDSDFLTLLAIWEAFHEEMERLSQRQLRAFCRDHFLSYLRVREWRDLHSQLQREVDLPFSKLPPPPGPGDATRSRNSSWYRSVHRALSVGLLGNIAFEIEGNRFRATGGREVQLFPASALYRPPKRKKGSHEPEPSRRRSQAITRWIVSAEVVETARLFARTNAWIQPEWLLDLATHVVREKYSQPEFDEPSGRVLVRRSRFLHGLELERKRVDFEKLDPGKAREIFIRSALVQETEQEPVHPLPAFVEKNRQVRARLETIRTRLRSMDTVWMDETVYRFYDRVLPPVASWTGLRHWLRQHHDPSGNSLLAKPGDLLPDAESVIDENAFPAQAPLGQELLPLQYKFSPGEDTDGVTIEVPVDQIRGVTPEFLEYLVPGFLEEKVLHLLKTLPKSLRRSLIPLPETARRLVPRLQPSMGSVPAALAGLLGEDGLSITEGDFDPSALPPHLLIRLSAVDRQGRTIASGRSLAQVGEQLRAAERSAAASRNRALQEAWAEAQASWYKPDRSDWDWDDLPEKIPVYDQAGLQIWAYPGLRITKGGITLELFRDETAAQTATAEALPRLLELATSRDLTWLEKDLKDIRKLGPDLVILGPPEEVIADALAHLKGRLCRVETPVRTRQAFQIEVARIREECRRCLPGFLDTLRSILEKRQQLLVHPSPFPDLTREVDRLAGRGFIGRTPPEWYGHLPRYLEALRRRCEKFRHKPERDAQFSQEMKRWEARLAQPRRPDTTATLQALERLRWSLEEYRVSLYAQELGTAQPVSPKRLEEFAKQAGV